MKHLESEELYLKIYAIAYHESKVYGCVSKYFLSNKKGKKKDLGMLTLKLTGSINGNVKKVDVEKNAGINVHIPGTSINTKTDENGDFSIQFLPEGSWEIRVDADGYVYNLTNPQSIKAGETTTLKDMILQVYSDKDGGFSINNGRSVSGSRSVELFIVGPEGAKKFKVYEDKTADSAIWKPLTTKSYYFFDSDGEKTLYIKFADEKENQTNSIKQNILIDTLNVVNTQVTFASCNEYCNERTTTLNMAAEGASHMICDEDDSFPNNPIEYKSKYSYTFSGLQGMQTIYCRYLDSDGNHTDSITLSTILDTILPDTFTIDKVGRRVSNDSEVVTIVTESSDTNFDGYQALGGQYESWTDVNPPIEFRLATDNTWYDLGIRAIDKASNSTAKNLLLYKGNKTILENKEGDQKTLAIEYSPYLLTSEIGENFTFFKGVNINEGVTVYVDAGLEVIVNSNFTISGTNINPVIITSNSSSPNNTDWSLTFQQSIYDTISAFYLNISNFSKVNIKGQNYSFIDSTFSNYESAFVMDSNVALDFKMHNCIFDGGSPLLIGNTNENSIVNIRHSIFKNASTAITVTGNNFLDIYSSNFINNTQNILIGATSTNDNRLVKNYWGYNSLNGTTNDLLIEISDDASGTTTYTPYMTVEIQRTGPR